MITSEEIKRRLWDGANELRGSMDASRYKDYMLGLMFYKFLSDKTLEEFKISSGLGQITESELVEEYVKAKIEYGEELDKMLQIALGYYVAPEYLYQTWLKDINSGNFEVQKVTDSLNNFERTIAVSSDSKDFIGLFFASVRWRKGNFKLAGSIKYQICCLVLIPVSMPENRVTESIKLKEKRCVFHQCTFTFQ